MKTTDEKLKREISKRWKLIIPIASESSMRAHAQIEYILQEAGLLATPRKRRKKTADETIDLLGGGPRHTKD